MNSYLNKLFSLFVIMCCTLNINCAYPPAQADLVIFSYDRPLQLYALLESIEAYVKNVGQITVIYRSSDTHFEHAYQQVQQRFEYCLYLPQGVHPRADFKPLTLRATFESPNEHVVFAVDDIIVKDHIDLAECIYLLNTSQAYGFYLRLGQHLCHCYTMNHDQNVPPLTHVVGDVYAWQFKQSQLDWNYPHTVDMTVYRKKDIEDDFRNLEYFSPNSLEGIWASKWHKTAHRFGLCYANSKIVNLPLNRVQNDILNRTTNFLTPMQMLGEFNAGKKIDIQPLFQVQNKSAHMEYEPQLILRY